MGFWGALGGRIVDLREGGVRAARGKRVRTGSGEDQRAAHEGRVQLDVVGVEDFAERVVRCADVRERSGVRWNSFFVLLVGLLRNKRKEKK